MQALWGEPTSDFTRMRRNRMHVCCGLVAEWLSLASLLCSESMLRRCAKSTFETFELQRPMYVRCKPHVPLLNLNRTHAPSEGDGRTIHDNIYKYTDSAGVDRTRRGSLRLAPIIIIVSFPGRKIRPGLHCFAHARYSQKNLGISARLNIFRLPFQ